MTLTLTSLRPSTILTTKHCWKDSTLIIFALTALPSLGFTPYFPTDLNTLSLAMTLPPLLYFFPGFPRALSEYPYSSRPILHPCPTSLGTSTCLFTNTLITRAFILSSPTTVSPNNLTICVSAQMPLTTGISSIFFNSTRWNPKSCLSVHPHTSRIYLPHLQ